jgi:hypothetical protein
LKETTMNKRTAEEIARHSEGDIETVDNYSGRGMMGRTTTGITAPDITSILVAVAVAARKMEAADFSVLLEDLSGAETDSLGNDLIIY